MPIPLRSDVCPRISTRNESDFPASFAVARGDWAAVPEQASLEDMWTVALAVNGYEVDGLFGFDVCSVHKRADDHGDTGSQQQTALALWCRLFLAVRAARHMQLDEEDAAPLITPKYQALVHALKTDGSVLWLGYGLARAECHAERWVPNLVELQARGERELAACDARLQSDSLRVVEEGTDTVLEAVRVRWRSVAEPTEEWGEVRRWNSPPSPAELAAAKASALEDPRFFERCQVCRLRFVHGHMWRRDISQGCASRYWGVLF